LIFRGVGLMTNVALAATRGRVDDRGGYVVVADPDDPTSVLDNLLVLPAAPNASELEGWTRTLASELPAIRHTAFQWEMVGTDFDPALAAAGFSVEAYDVMVADEPIVTPARAENIGALAADDVLATAELAFAIADRHDAAYRAMLQRRASWHRNLVARGSARFWGVRDAGVLVASAGIATIDAIARYQDVQTLASHRRRGLATALVVVAARDAFARGAERLVIVAERDSAAARLYARLGFRAVERIASATRVSG
jgi:GNAT superfamily N-acetyltransferase